MEELARSDNTPALDASFDALTRIAVDPESDDRYPSGTVLIPADAPDFSVLASAAVKDEKPIAVVFPDGSDLVARPRETKGLVMVMLVAVLRLVDRASRKRDRPTYVPREWVTEFHAAPDAREPEPVS